MGPPRRPALLQRRVAVPRAAALCAARDNVVTVGEGQTLLQPSDGVASYVGPAARPPVPAVRGDEPLGQLQGQRHVGRLHATPALIGANRAACASTGNTSASLALYCSVTRLMKAVIFIGSGKISYGKLSQALDYGALTVQIAGDFDDAMARVQEVCQQLGIYLVNSVNPFRLEGQKTIMFRVLEGAALGSARLDRRARRQPGQLQRLRQGVPRAARAGPDRPRAAAGRDQRRRRQHALRAGTSSRGLRWNGGQPDHGDRRRLLRRDGRRSTAAPRPSPAPSKSTGR